MASFSYTRLQNTEFSPILLKKNKTKFPIFDHKQWTNPSGRKSTPFYPEHEETNFSGLISPNNNHEKIFEFLKKNHGLTPLEILDFLNFFKNFTFLV